MRAPLPLVARQIREIEPARHTNTFVEIAKAWDYLLDAIANVVIVRHESIPVDGRSSSECRLRQSHNDHWLRHEIAGGRIEVALGFGDDSHRVLDGHELLASLLRVALCAADRRQDERVLAGDEMCAIE